MDGLNRETCGFAQKGTCKLHPDKCVDCKVDKAASDLHASLCVGHYTWDDVQKMQQGRHSRRRGMKSKYNAEGEAGIDFVNGITRDQKAMLRTMTADQLRVLINLAIAKISEEIKGFSVAQKKWDDKGTMASLKNMRLSLLKIGKMQRSFQVIRMEYLVAQSTEEMEDGMKSR